MIFFDRYGLLEPEWIAHRERASDR
jgi:hypothetical protein